MFAARLGRRPVRNAAVALTAVCAAAVTVPVAWATETTTSVNDAAFRYSGAWKVSSGAAKYRSDDRYTSRPNSTYSFSFTGTGLKIYASKASHHGIMAVSLDGGRETRISLYARTRADQVLVYSRRGLAPGTHRVRVRAAATRPAGSSGRVINADRIDVIRPSAGTPSPAPTSAPKPSSAPAPSPTTAPSTAGWRTVLNDQFNRPMTLKPATNGTYPDWWVESTSGPFVSKGATLSKTNNTRFNRIFSAKRFGGPGKTVRFRYRARATKLYSDGGWAGFRGIKAGMKFPTSCTRYSKDDPRSVYGKPPGQDPNCNPGSYITVDGIMEDGRYEVARNGYGTVGYSFLNGPKRPYTVGTWAEKTVEIAWIGGNDVRFRFWNNATGTGTPVWETTDTSSPFLQPGYLWWRLDYADGEWDYFIIEEQPTS